MTTPPPIVGIHETILYGRDLSAAERFYSGALGLRVISRSDRAVSFRVRESCVLLIFDPERSARDAAAHNVPAHGAAGPGHVAMTVADGSLPAWRRKLAADGIDIELERSWDLGGRSLYVRDPAGNSVELIDGRVWPD